MGATTTGQLVLVVALALAGCALMRKPAERRAAKFEELLGAAGFNVHPADTPEKLQRLEHLEPHRLTLSQRSGRNYYWYADPTGCRCLYVGDEAAYQLYDRLQIEREIADSDRAAAQMESDAAEVDAGMRRYFEPYPPYWLVEFP